MNILFLTGAGISANAGIPVYRGTGSSWTDSDLEAKSHSTRYGNHLDELWEKHWGPMSVQMKAAEPTYTHKAIAEFQKHHDVIIATQNIDNLHEKAGSENVAHLHGTLNPKCMKCKSELVVPWALGDSRAPRCINCQSHKTRPDVVLFGENLNAKLMNGLNSFAGSADYVIAVGTSLNVFPATGLVMDNLGKAIIINKDETKFNRFAIQAFEADCDEVIDDVLAGLTVAR